MSWTWTSYGSRIHLLSDSIKSLLKIVCKSSWTHLTHEQECSTYFEGQKQKSEFTRKFASMETYNSCNRNLAWKGRKENDSLCPKINYIHFEDCSCQLRPHSWSSRHVFKQDAPTLDWGKLSTVRACDDTELLIFVNETNRCISLFFVLSSLSHLTWILSKSLGWGKRDFFSGFWTH